MLYAGDKTRFVSTGLDDCEPEYSTAFCECGHLSQVQVVHVRSFVARGLIQVAAFSKDMICPECGERMEF